MPVWHRQIIQYLTLIQPQRSHQGETLFINSQVWISVETTHHFVQEDDWEKKNEVKWTSSRPEGRNSKGKIPGWRQPKQSYMWPSPMKPVKSQLSIGPSGWNSCWGQSGWFSLFAGLNVNCCCFTSTETVGLLGMGAQDSHFDFHTSTFTQLLSSDLQDYVP